MRQYLIYSKYYSEPQFWNKLRRIVKQASSHLLYYALLLYYVMLDNKVTLNSKAMIVAALGYLILPLDALPDFIPALGLTDDLAALTMVYNKVKKSITAETEKKADEKVVELMGIGKRKA
jgi:uncharacterized membrane protein YkvA (DUF1232 family)